MVDRVVIEVARRNLQTAAGLEEGAFWREYAAIEDAALFCTDPKEHGLLMDMLNAMLLDLGKIRGFDTGLSPGRKTRDELDQKLSRLAIDLPAILRFTAPESRSAALSEISLDLLSSASPEDQDYVSARLERLCAELGVTPEDRNDTAGHVAATHAS
jgi:hypothetical protein